MPFECLTLWPGKWGFTVKSKFSAKMCCGTKTQVDFLKTTEKKKYSKETCLGNVKQKYWVEVMNKGQNWNTLWSDMKL